MEHGEPDGLDNADERLEQEEIGARRRRSGSGVILAAAMTAVGEILEPEKTRVEVVQTNDQPRDDPRFDLDFGDLPPLR